MRYNMSYEIFKAEQTQKLNTIFQSLDAGEYDKDEIKQNISSVVELQAKYGHEQYQKKASQIKKFEEVLNSIGYDQEKYQSVKDFAESFKQEKTIIDQTKSEKDQLIERIKRLEAEDAERKTQSEKIKRENEINTIKNKLTETIGDKLKGSKYIIKDLINEGHVKLVDGEVMFVNGDEVMLYDKGIQSVLEANADLVVNNQIPGINTTKTKVNGQPQQSLSLEQINKMGPDELRTHMAEIKKMAGVR